MAYVNQEKETTSSSLNNFTMTQENYNPPPIYFQNFATSQQATLFQELKNNQFSGRICWKNSQGQESSIYWYLGRIIYATGGIHPVRRWRRTVLQGCPQLKTLGFQSITIQQDIAASLRKNHPISWDYDVLSSWFKQQKINRTQLSEIIVSIVTEVLFDLMQGKKVTCHFYADTSFSSPLVFFDPQQIIVATWKSWQHWHRSTLGNHSPNKAPVIKSLEQFKQRTSSKTYAILTQYIDGNRSLRDLAIKMNQDLLRLTLSLMLYIQLGMIELVEIEDLPQPLALPTCKTKPIFETRKKLIACVHNNPKVCHLIKEIVNDQGYQFMGINDSIKAITLFVAHKPDLIFVDLNLPGIDGWEICRRLSKTQTLQTSPIILLVEKERIFERLQSKIVGCSALVSKPLNRQQILDTMTNYLAQTKAA